MKKKINNKYIIIIPILILNIISLIYLKNTEYFKKELIFLSVSYILLFIFSKINYRIITKYLKYLYLFNIFLLILVLFIGKEINGSKAWLHILGISIQPSEITKLILIIYLSYLTFYKKNILYIFLITLIPSVLTFLEPDTGSIIIYLIIFISTLKYIKIPKKYYILAFIILLLLLTSHIFIYLYNKDLLIKLYSPKIFYRFDRLISFKKQNNIQNIYSLISIGAGKLLYIPENHNDFIFASIISKYNFLAFITIIICLTSILIYYLKNITSQNNISNILNFMVLNVLLFQMFYNILMNISLVPIIGIPLPFLSYGGSYLTTLYIIIGLTINLNINKNKV